MLEASRAAFVRPTVIRDYLGHSSVATTSRYVTTNLQMKRDALETFWKRAGLEAKASRKWRPSPQLLTSSKLCSVIQSRESRGTQTNSAVPCVLGTCFG
jgi:hypothetical protein